MNNITKIGLLFVGTAAIGGFVIGYSNYTPHSIPPQNNVETVINSVVSPSPSPNTSPIPNKSTTKTETSKGSPAPRTPVTSTSPPTSSGGNSGGGSGMPSGSPTPRASMNLPPNPTSSVIRLPR